MTIETTKEIGTGENTIRVKPIPLSTGGLIALNIGDESICITRYNAAKLIRELVSARAFLEALDPR